METDGDVRVDREEIARTSEQSCVSLAENGWIARGAYNGTCYARNRTYHQPGSSGVLALINPPWGPPVRGLTDEPARIHVDVCGPFGA